MNNEGKCVEFFMEYAAFLAKTVTLVVAVLVILAAAVVARSKGRRVAGQLQVDKLNDFYKQLRHRLEHAVLDKDQLKAAHKEEAKAAKLAKKAGVHKPRVFVLDFDGDIKASATDSLRHEITALLSLATPQDEVVLRLESGGGMVHSYGLASSQLVRIRQAGIPLTICIDKVAASGGYMMACVADQILTAPFAVLGSIGVAAPLPNAHRLLERHGIDYEEVTAGEYKRTVSYLGKITDKGKQKFQEQIDDMHRLFKEFVRQNRPAVDVEQVATGEHWYGLRAIELGLANAVATSDDYLMGKVESCDIYQLWYERPRSVRNRIASTMRLAGERFADGLWSRLGASAPP
jgi:serine protease SohB